MNTREIMREVSWLAAERGWEEGSQTESCLVRLLADREEARGSLRRKVAALRRDLDRLDTTVQVDSPILNTLGELQGKPAAVEAAVGEFSAADRALRVFLEAFPAIGEAVR